MDSFIFNDLQKDPDKVSVRDIHLEAEETSSETNKTNYVMERVKFLSSMETKVKLRLYNFVFVFFGFAQQFLFIGKAYQCICKGLKILTLKAPVVLSVFCLFLPTRSLT